MSEQSSEAIASADVSVDTSPVTAPEVTSSEPAAGSPPGALAVGAEGQPQAPAYTPDFKWRVGEPTDPHHKAGEFDEWLRPVIKSKDIENKIRDLYTAHHGMEVQKPKYETAVSEREEIGKAYNTLVSDVQEAMTFKNSGDFDTFFEKVGVKEQDVAKWMLDKLQREQLPPDQKRVYDELRISKKQEFDRQKEVSSTEQRYRQIAVELRNTQIDMALAKPEVGAVSQNYDAKHGPGSFKQFVAQIGLMHFNLHGQDPAAGVAVAEALKIVGDGYKGGDTNVATAAAAGQRELPVIPNISGRNVSPTRKTPRSTDEIRQLAAQMMRSGSAE